MCRPLTADAKYAHAWATGKPCGAELLAIGTDLWFRSPAAGGFVRAPRDGYWAHEQVTRIDLATGGEELVADLPFPTWCSGLAVTREWLFVSANNVLYRIAKPAP